jgi:hypothetical protein
LDIVNVTGLEKDYAALAEGVVRRIRGMGLLIRGIFADREHFNIAVIAKCSELGVEFIMAAKTDKCINKLLRRHKEEQGLEAAIFTYHFRDERSPDFYLVAIPNREYDPRKRVSPENKEFLLFATEIAFNSPEKFVKPVPQSYRARWKIETGYRVKKEFKIRTCSRSYVVRVLFFVVQCLMHNFLNLLKRIPCITAHQLKYSRELFTFIICPGVEPTNNAAERALRPRARQRKIWGCFRTEKGSENADILMSALETLRKQRKDLFIHEKEYILGQLPLKAE